MFKFQSVKKKILPTPKEERLCLVKVTHKTHNTGQEVEGQDAIKEQVPFIKEIAALPRSTRSSVLQTQREGSFLRKPQKCVMGRNAQLPSSELGGCCRELRCACFLGSQAHPAQSVTPRYSKDPEP